LKRVNGPTVFPCCSSQYNVGPTCNDPCGRANTHGRRLAPDQSCRLSVPRGQDGFFQRRKRTSRVVSRVHGTAGHGSRNTATGHGSWPTSTVAPQVAKCQNHSCYCLAPRRETYPPPTVSNGRRADIGLGIRRLPNPVAGDPESSKPGRTSKKAWVQRSKMAS
jgi:hypothetical protein